jgi:serine/threonine protein kinase
LRRTVALKVIKPGMDSKQVIARFEAERQALALMDHTNIARVLDAGATDAGRPYFVMELVCGTAITEFSDQNQLSLRERLELLVAVCQAVQHAHQKGIIHRDLKPSNVLVTLLDGTPVAKVIDFGIAKALGQGRLTDKTLCTGFAQMIGTPLYMSPEQAGMSGQDADTRTDIYSLGVLLYELLTGATPFDKERLKEASYEELRRIIREEEPVKPSTRISTLGQAATTISANRKSEPKRLSQLFRGELDWIVMKALEKDRNRRYKSAGSFAADVQHYLDDEPVQACPPSAVYRFRKFARRNWGALVTAAIVACAVLLALAGLGASTVLTLQAKNELQQTLERERQNSYFQRIALAEREWSANNVRRWEQLLDRCPPDLRGWEWHYLRRLDHKPMPPMQHGGAVFGLAVRPDGRQLASCSQDGSIKIWDAKTGQNLCTIPAHKNHARSVAFSPNGQRLASASWDGTVKIWDTQTGQELHTLQGHQGEVWSVVFSPDGNYLASGGGKSGQVGEVKIWNAVTGQVVQTLLGHTSSVYSVAFSPDGKRLAWGGSDGMVKLWDAATGQEQCSLAGSGNHYQVFGVAFSPDGRRIAWGGTDSTVKLWQPATGEIHVFRGHTNWVHGVAFSPDGKQIASGSADHTLRVWRAPPLPKASEPAGGEPDLPCQSLPRSDATTR